MTPIQEAPGASNCNQTGYKGRVGLYEVLGCPNRLRADSGWASGPELRRKAIEEE